MKSLPKWVIPVILIVLVGMYIGGMNNNAIQYEEEAETAWSDVENAYQRRTDLIPNLVKTVEGAADFERGTLKDVVDARAKATSVNVDPSNLDDESIAQFEEAQSELSGALSRLLVSVERYPDLKATQNFRELQSQLEGTENRINVARDRFNEAVKHYNTYVRKFPQNIFMNMLGFNKMKRFEADEGAETAPDVDFDFD